MIDAKPLLSAALSLSVSPAASIADSGSCINSPSFWGSIASSAKNSFRSAIGTTPVGYDARRERVTRHADLSGSGMVAHDDQVLTQQGWLPRGKRAWLLQ